MNIELQRQLFSRYPKFFRKPGQRLGKTSDGEEYWYDDAGPLDFWGIECGDGWYDIIDRLAAACEAEIQKLVDAGVENHAWPRSAQIKEKFGGLRFYVNGPLDEAVWAQIREAADEISLRVCETCGQPGELRGKGWVHTACDACEARLQATGRQWDSEAYEARKKQLDTILKGRREQ